MVELYPINRDALARSTIENDTNLQKNGTN